MSRRHLLRPRVVIPVVVAILLVVGGFAMAQPRRGRPERADGRRDQG